MLLSLVSFNQNDPSINHAVSNPAVIRNNAGLFGAYLVIAWLLKRPLTSVWVLLGMNLVIMMLFPGIAWQAHVGGFLAGAAATGAVGLDLIRRRSGRPSLAWPGIALVNLLIVAVIVLRYTVFA